MGEENTIKNVKFKTTANFDKAIQEKMIYMKKKSKDLRDLESTVESIINFIDEEGMTEREKGVLTRVFTNFFARNLSLNVIQADKQFYFYQNPIVLINAPKYDGIGSFENGYIAYEAEDEIKLRVLDFVAGYGLYMNLFKHHVNFSFEQFAPKMLNVLKVNEQLSDYVFAFNLGEVSKDRILIDTKYVDIIETKDLFNDDKSVSGLYTYSDYKRTIKYERNSSPPRKFQTIIHELLHGTIETTGLNFVEVHDRHDKDNDLIEEEIVHRLAYSLSTLIMDSPEFVMNVLDNYASFYIPTEQELLNKREHEFNKEIVQTKKILNDQKEHIKKLEKLATKLKKGEEET